MSRKVSTCLYIDRGTMETAKQVGLNVSRVAEGALVQAVGRLTRTVLRIGLVSFQPVVVEGRGGISTRALGSTGL